MKKKNLLVLAGALIIGSGALASCTKSGTKTTSQGGGTSTTDGAKKVTLKVWTSTPSLGFMEKAVAKFKEANPTVNYDITVEGVEEDKVQEKLTTDKDLAADVFHFPGDQIVKLQSQNLLYSLPEAYVNTLGIAKGVLGSGQIDGKQYAIPYTPNTYFLYYDANVYTDDDVKSLDSMLAVDMATKTGYDADAYNIACDFGGGWYGQSIFFSAGCEMVNDGTVVGFTGDQAIQDASDFLFDMAVTKKAKVVSTGSGADMYGSKAAAFISGTWSANGLTKDYKCAALPKLTLGGTQKAWKAVGDYKMIGVKATTDFPSDAAKLTAFLSTAEIQTLRFQENSTAPTNQKALDDNAEVFATNEPIKGQTATLENTFAQPSNAYAANNYWNAYGAFYPTMQAATNATEAKAAVDAFNTALSTYTKA